MPDATVPLARFIDHTLLKPEATAVDIRRLCAEALEHGFAAVCVNGSRVPLAAALLAGSAVKIAAVAGFPLGAMATAAKCREVGELVRLGAHEVDMVLPVGHLKEGADDYVRRDVAEVVLAAAGQPVKVILETCLLTDDEKVRACRLCVEAGAAFVKTSTGFNKAGATLADVALMKRTVGDACQVKAAGGVRDAASAQAMIAAGATRLGTSSGVLIVTGGTGTGY
ncbi:MAG: deoxyribose-phosphate aldolase [Limisphaerales bacterium]